MYRFSVLAIQAIVAAIREQFLDELVRRDEFEQVRIERIIRQNAEIEALNVSAARASAQYEIDAREVDAWTEMQEQDAKIRARELA